MRGAVEGGRFDGESGCGRRSSVLAAAAALKVRLVLPTNRSSAVSSTAAAATDDDDAATAAGRNIRESSSSSSSSSLPTVSRTRPKIQARRRRRPAYVNDATVPRDPASERRCQFGRTAGATVLRARPISPVRLVFWRRATAPVHNTSTPALTVTRSVDRQSHRRPVELPSKARDKRARTHTNTHTHTRHIHTSHTYTHSTHTHTHTHARYIRARNRNIRERRGLVRSSYADDVLYRFVKIIIIIII